MVGPFFYRDPRRPQDVRGPVSEDQLRNLVREGRLRPADQVSLDGHAWLPAKELEPEIFPVGQPPWKPTMARLVSMLKSYATAAWTSLKTVANFYWNYRAELRQLATEYLPVLKEAGSRREIRVSAQDNNEAVSFDGKTWRAELPDCCVVCGEPANCDWNIEQRSIPNLTWPLFGPFFGLLFGTVGWIFLWASWGRLLVPLGILLGFVLGYRGRSETVVTVRFRRCREHLNRTRFPSLRTYGKTLVIGIGDRKVWRRFFYGDRDMETPLAVPPSFTQIVESKGEGISDAAKPEPSYPTIPLAGDEETDNKA